MFNNAMVENLNSCLDARGLELFQKFQDERYADLRAMANSPSFNAMGHISDLKRKLVEKN